MPILIISHTELFGWGQSVTYVDPLTAQKYEYEIAAPMEPSTNAADGETHWRKVSEKGNVIEPILMSTEW
jgi:hypothetical protein